MEKTIKEAMKDLMIIVNKDIERQQPHVVTNVKSSILPNGKDFTGVAKLNE